MLEAPRGVAMHLGEERKAGILLHDTLRTAKRIFGIPDFRYYAPVDGIKVFLPG